MHARDTLGISCKISSPIGESMRLYFYDFPQAFCGVLSVNLLFDPSIEFFEPIILAMNKEIVQFLMLPIIWWFETISSLGSQSLGLTWVCWLQERVLPGPSICFIFQATKLENTLLFVAGEFNLPVGMLKFVLGLLAAFPMALLIRMIPCTLSSWKHLLGAISGLFVLQFVFGSDWLHPVVSSLGTYLLLCFMPRKHLPMAVTLWSLGTYIRFITISTNAITTTFTIHDTHLFIHQTTSLPPLPFPFHLQATW